MALDRSDVEKIAHLARLQIDEQEIPQYTENLSSILDLVNQMQAVDTSDIEPMANSHDAVQRLRADEVTEQNNREKTAEHRPCSGSGPVPGTEGYRVSGSSPR